MKQIRKSTAVWNGNIMEGKGFLTTESKALNETPYTWKSRFENGIGTNPEELMASAHAGCFTMKLSLDLTSAGFIPESLQTTAAVTLEDGAINKSHLTLTAKVPTITEEEFKKIVEGAKANCPVSKAYNLEIVLDYTLLP